VPASTHLASWQPLSDLPDDDIVTVENAPGLMPRKGHGYSFGNPRPDQIANRRPSEIVENLSCPLETLALAFRAQALSPSDFLEHGYQIAAGLAFIGCPESRLDERSHP